MSRHRILRPREQQPLTELDERKPWRRPLRRAQWSAYWQRFFGGGRPGDSIPARYKPIDLDEAVYDVDHALHDCGSCLPEVRREPARRCVSQMLLSGYRPAERVRPAFDRVAQQAVHPDLHTRGRAPTGVRGVAESLPPEDSGLHAGETEDLLISWGEREFDVQGWFRRRVLTVDEELAFAGSETRLISLPTTITHRGGAFTVEKRVYIRGDLDPVKWLVNPVNWEELGQFFARTEREKDQKRFAEGDAESWRDVLCEDFLVSWNGFMTYSFRQKLKVDYSVTADVARSDYSLMYEQDDQIELNEGFFEVAKYSSNPEWLAGTMRKTLRFSSSVLNMMAPAILSMFLDSKADGFNRLAQELSSRPGTSNEGS